MEKRDIARIECLAPDGSFVVAVVLTPDMEEISSIDLSPIIELPPEIAAEHGETALQLRENGRYYYDLERSAGARDLRLRCHLARRRRNIGTGDPDSGRLETGGFCGTLLLEITEGDSFDQTQPALASALIDVRSLKLDYRSEYRGMLRSIAARMADLVADSRSSTKTSFRSTFEERSDSGWFQVQLELLREVLESVEFSAAMQRILAFPHEKLEHEQESVSVERSFRWSEKATQALATSPTRCALPSGHPLRALGLKSIATAVPVIKKTPTVDTPENRFIKHALLDFHAFLSRAESVFKAAPGNWSTAADLSQRLSLGVEQWLSRPLFKEVESLTAVPLGSPVLQRKPGYREVLRWWLRFRTAAELSWKGGEDLFHAGQRNVAELYEYWLFFQLLDWFCDRFGNGIKPPLEQLVEGLDGEFPNLRVKKKIPLGPFTGTFSSACRPLHAEFSYNRQFDVVDSRELGGSWTRKMHPDYTLTLWPAYVGMAAADAAKFAESQESLVHLHLDAKYRVESIAALFGERTSEDIDEEDTKRSGKYKRQDLLKMHAYRDAIKRSEGAYVLYPGNDQSRASQFHEAGSGSARWPHTMRGFHEILPGLGAFAISPDEHGEAKGLAELSKFLDEILINLSDRSSLREQRTADLYEVLRQRRSLYGAGEAADIGSLMMRDAPELDADNLRASPAQDVMILVGWFDSPEAKNWMLDNARVVLRLGKRRGSLPLIKSLAAATFIMLHGRDKEVLPGLRRILPEAGEVLTREEILAEGFPTDPGKDPDHIFAVFSIGESVEFPDLSWNGDKLNDALLRFHNRQRPAYKKELSRLTRDIAKPWLVSLADMELALVK